MGLRSAVNTAVMARASFRRTKCWKSSWSGIISEVSEKATEPKTDWYLGGRGVLVGIRVGAGVAVGSRAGKVPAISGSAVGGRASGIGVSSKRSRSSPWVRVGAGVKVG